ncbi:hypothetical protein RHMOL_Rhmol13G0289200 [Rhododendron molle]|uniref:Uncharacterized protein n=1 Tax=Rhododendron molle TaxID=49168 RepID=A0ACC0LC82_RHOML|nr:hypothetical protein RHMOL_Rhmol13G0289200 [Rhododendron molle]
MSSSLEPPPKRDLVIRSSNDQQIQPNLMVPPATFTDHVSNNAVYQKQEEQHQPFGNFNGFRFSLSVFFSRFRFRFIYVGWSQTEHFPPGYRFCPLDSELIVYYLQKKVDNEAMPHNGIRDVNLYLHNPAHLTAQYPALGDKKWYFFTPRNRKYPNGVRPDRAAGDGYWKATGADKPVEQKNQVVGLKKALVYYEGKPGRGENNRKTNWIMHEFRVNGPPRIKKSQHDMKLDDWVLCRIYKKEVSEKGENGEVQGQVPERGKKSRVQAQHKPAPGPAATLLEGGVPCVNDNYLMGESSKYDEYIQSPQHPKFAQSMDEFLPYHNIFAASDPQPNLGYSAWPLAARVPPVHLDDNKYFEDNDLDDFDKYDLFAQNPNPAPGQNSDNVPV